MQTNNNEMWEAVVSAGERAAYSYQQMVCAADALADVLDCDEDYVLRRVLPRQIAERRDGERILDWLNRDRRKLEAHVWARQEARKEAARRGALLAKLKLNPDEQRLLGIKQSE